MKLSKRILADYNLETQPNYWNEFDFKNYDYVSWHGPSISEQQENDRTKNNAYSISHPAGESNDISESLLSMRMNNRKIVVNDIEDL